MKDKQLFTLFNTSYKDFKTNFFKVAIKDSGRSSFYLDDGQPKFPFYWIKDPKKIISWAKTDMTPDELDAISQLDQLPWRTSSRKLIGLLGFDGLCTRAIGKIFNPILFEPFMTYLNFSFYFKYL